MMPKVGAVYQLTEEDYKYGLGSLVVKVSRIIKPVQFDAETWFHIEAHCRYPDHAGEPFTRQLYVREGAIKP